LKYLNLFLILILANCNSAQTKNILTESLPIGEITNKRVLVNFDINTNYSKENPKGAKLIKENENSFKNIFHEIVYDKKVFPEYAIIKTNFKESNTYFDFKINMKLKSKLKISPSIFLLFFSGFTLYLVPVKLSETDYFFEFELKDSKNNIIHSKKFDENLEFWFSLLGKDLEKYQSSDEMYKYIIEKYLLELKKDNLMK
jgi:hypothetical protein